MWGITSCVIEKRARFGDGKIVTMRAMKQRGCKYEIAYLGDDGRSWHHGCKTIADFYEHCEKHNVHSVLFIYHPKKKQFEIVKSFMPSQEKN